VAGTTYRIPEKSSALLRDRHPKGIFFSVMFFISVAFKMFFKCANFSAILL